MLLNVVLSRDMDGHGAKAIIHILLQLLLKYLRGNNHPLNLVGALENLSQLCIPEEPFHGIFLHIPITAKDLDSICGNLHRNITAKTLGH